MNAVREIETLLGVNGHHHAGYIPMPDRERIAEIARQLATLGSCDGCRHDLGGGQCGANLEAECGEGRHEAWEA